MATGGSSDLAPVAFGTVLSKVRDTLCDNIDVKMVGELLCKKEVIPKAVKKKIKAAVKTKRVDIFYGVIKDFDLKTFVAFVEVLQHLSLLDEKHRIVFSLTCSCFRNWNIYPDPENQQHIAKLNAIIEECGKSDNEIKFRPKEGKEDKCPEGTTDVTSSTVETINSHTLIRLRPHLSEDTIFSREQEENVFYSHTHGVTVIADREALPHRSLNIVLTVNDYSRRVIIPAGYDASYSALISLKCEPELDSFLDFVSVTIPHCAVGDIDSLCILSAPEDSSHREIYLKEDSDIEIDTIDEHYFTFRTKHFTKHKVAASLRNRRKQKKRKNPKAGHSSVANTRGRVRSFDAPESPTLGPTKKKLVTDLRFVALKYNTSKDQTSSQQKCMFFVTYALNSFIEVRNYTSICLFYIVHSNVIQVLYGHNFHFLRTSIVVISFVM